MKFTHTKSKQPKLGGLLPTKLVPKFSLKDLSGRDLKRAATLTENRVPFFPPTMSPAAAMDGDLESLQWALNYYAKAGYEEVCLQTKMMGSRCVVVIRPDETFAISKNGFLIDHVDLESEFVRLRAIVEETLLKNEPQVILDCELMPWSAMGKGLIDKTFYGYADLVDAEILALSRNNFVPVLQQFQNMDTTDAPAHIKKAKKLYDRMKDTRLEEESEHLRLFRASLSNYDQEYSPRIEPFQVLFPWIPTAGAWDAWNSWFMFRSDGCISCSTSNIEKAQNFRESLDTTKTEGIVVKPLTPSRDVAPYLKVRNKEYLRIVYGPGYTKPLYLQKLISRKNIGGKLKRSITEWRACFDMLNGADIESIICGLLFTPEPELDPRL